jgi:lysyl-tRNA synthetase class 1
MSLSPVALVGRPSSTLSRATRAGPYEPLYFSEIRRRALAFADHIETHRELLAEVLLSYETFEVVEDETARTLDLFCSLDENAEYFALRIGEVTSFLPKNQPLYALSCYVAVPALMASAVHFRVPHCMRSFYPDLLRALAFDRFFPNVFPSFEERLPFLRARSGLRLDPSTGETLPVSDAVLFTGTTQHAERLRRIFDRRTLFLTNGAGHNPLVISADADLGAAAEAALTLQLYNQGQDCAAPNAILVHARVHDRFVELLEEKLLAVRVGPYRDRACRVGPISDPTDLPRIQVVLVENRDWLRPRTPGVIRAREAIVEPTIVCRPLAAGGNFAEVFAPLLFVQRYENDAALASYFEHPRYAQNAMYVTVYGTNPYVRGLVGRPVNGRVLHDETSVLHDTHLHAPGVERGTQPYGGYGIGASSLRIGGRLVALPTLPQRDLHRHVALPLLARGAARARQDLLRRATRAVERDVEKLLALKPADARADADGVRWYADVSSLRASGKRYVSVDDKSFHPLLASPNAEQIAALGPREIALVCEFRRRLGKSEEAGPDAIERWLYDLPKVPGASPAENRAAQRAFFRILYQLLFGRDEGPRLAEFLADAEPGDIARLLDV